MKKSQYFADALNHVNNEFLGADGWEAGDGWGADGYEEMQGGLNAEGGRPAANSQSLPFVIILENTTTATVSDVEILNSAENFNNYAVSGISITYGLSGITYNTFLGRINSGQTFEVGQLRLIASSSTSGRAELQVLQTVKVTTKTIDGRDSSMQLRPQKDSFQYIATQVDSYVPFMVDSLTAITFASILGSTTVQVYLYPMASTNPFGALKGKGASQYSNPNTNFSLKKR